MSVGDVDGRAIEERGNLFQGLLHPGNVARSRSGPHGPAMIECCDPIGSPVGGRGADRGGRGEAGDE